MSIDGYELGDVKRGDHVRAFHPHTLGVIHHGEVVLVGRKYVTIRFNVDGRTYKIHPRYIASIGA